MPRALITGITGQDGSYLAELLLEKGYEVWGLVRRSSTFNTERIDHLYQDPHNPNVRLRLVYGDLNDSTSLANVLEEAKPDEVYNLAAQSHVRVSFDIPEYTSEISGLGAVRLLEAMRRLDLHTRYYQASSSELYGKVHDTPQRETTPFHPRSPYAAAKAYAFYITQNYREAYGMFACNGILFNHESPRRGETFVTRKITRAATRIKVGLQKKLYLGNLDAKRDWGYAKDYVEAMWLMLQHSEPDDFVIATGETHSVREFLEKVFGRLDLDFREHVEHDARYERPAEVDLLLGDASKARKALGWEPKVGFDELVRLMVESDLAIAHQERALEEHKQRERFPLSEGEANDMVDWKTSRVLVTGGAGFLGSFLVEKLRASATQIFVPRSAEYDLVKGDDVRRLLHDTRPDIVLHLAARVGGIGANRENPGRFFYENAMMGIQLLHEAWRGEVSKLVAVGTICAYPKFTPVPFKEADMWNGYPEETNAPYGIAKKILSVQSAAYRDQYGFNSVVLYPVNLYGPRDNFDLQSSHVIPAMLRKFHSAKHNGEPKVVLWGDGSPTREFFYVEDCAEGILLASEKYDSSEPVNLGSGEEVSIKDLAERVKTLVGYTGDLVWDTTQPNGQPRRRLDVSRAEQEFGFRAKVKLEDGLRRTYEWMLANPS